MKIQRIKDRCNQCLLCVRDCVAGVWRNVNGEPVMVAPELCNRCSHCVAVCPQSAIYHESMDYDQVVKTDKDLANPDVYREIMRGRRSVRQFKDKPVPAELIEQILSLASHSPTASNKQNVGYTVITDKAVLASLSGSVFGFSRGLYEKTRKGVGKAFYRVLKAMSPDNVSRYLDPMDYYIKESEKGRDYILHNAPALILIHGPKKANFINENCNIAAANIMNFAHASGLGTCYIGFLTLALKMSSSLRKKTRVPSDRKVFAAIIIGYPAYRHTFTASRKLPEIQWVSSYAEVTE